MDKRLKLWAGVAIVSVLAAGLWFGRGYIMPASAPPAGQTAGPPGAGGGPGAGQGQGPRAVGVEVATPERMTIAQTLSAVGSLSANEAVTITAKSNGLVARINFQEGQRVAAGAVLVELEADDVRAKIAEFRAARQQVEQTLGRARQLLSTNNIPKARVDELESQLAVADARLRAEQARLDELVIRAPFAGRVGLRNISPGALIRPGEAITTLDDTRVMKLDFDLPEQALGALKAGLRVEGVNVAYPDRIFAGAVRTISPRIDPATRLVKLRAEIPNPDDLLRPGMFLNVRIALADKPNALTIPEQALLPLGDRQYVFVIEGDKARRVEVQIGQRIPGKVEILGGIDGQLPIAVAGLQQLRDGATVRILNAGKGGG